MSECTPSERVFLWIHLEFAAFSISLTAPYPSCMQQAKYIWPSVTTLQAFFFHHFPLKERISNFWFIPSCSQAFSSVFSDFPLLLQCRGSPSDYTWDIFIPRCPTMEIYNIFNACLHPLLLQHLLCFFITSSKDLGRKKLHRSSFHKEATVPNRTGAALAFILSSLLCLVSCLVWEETESFGNSLHNLLMRPLLPCPLYSGSFFNFCCLVWFNDTSLLWKPPVQQQEHSPPSA